MLQYLLSLLSPDQWHQAMRRAGIDPVDFHTWCPFWCPCDAADDDADADWGEAA